MHETLLSIKKAVKFWSHAQKKKKCACGKVIKIGEDIKS